LGVETLGYVNQGAEHTCHLAICPTLGQEPKLTALSIHMNKRNNLLTGQGPAVMLQELREILPQGKDRGAGRAHRPATESGL
jgi:hypothetical protein